MFFITDTIATQSEWFLLRFFISQRDLGPFTAGDTFGVIFDTYFYNFFEFNSFFYIILNDWVELFIYYQHNILNPNIVDVEPDSRFFFFS